MKRRVLPNSSRSAPLTGGRFRRPAKTHADTPSGAHFSHHLQVWRPAGGAGAQVTCTRTPMRDRMRPRKSDPCQEPAPRDNLLPNGSPALAVVCLRCGVAGGRRASMPGPARDPSPGSPLDANWGREGIRHPATMKCAGGHFYLFNRPMVARH